MKKRIWLGAATAVCVAAVCIVLGGLCNGIEKELDAKYINARPSQFENDGFYEGLTSGQYKNKIGEKMAFVMFECTVADEETATRAEGDGPYGTSYSYGYHIPIERTDHFFRTGTVPPALPSEVSYYFNYLQTAECRESGLDPFLVQFRRNISRGQRLLVIALEYEENDGNEEEHMKYATDNRLCFYVTLDDRVIPMSDEPWQQEFTGMPLRQAKTRLKQMAQAALKEA